MKRIWILFLMAFVAVLPDAGFARSLSLDRAVELVLQESQDIKKAAANVKKMQAILDGVNAGRWFRADANARYTNIVDMDDKEWWGSDVRPYNAIKMPGNMGTVGVSATQPIYTFGRIGYALDMARGSLKIAETSKQLAQIEMRAAAVQLYWSAKMMDEMVKVASTALKNTRDAQSKLTATGRANRSNLVKISADVAAREIDLNDAKFSRDSAFRMLKVYAGIDETENIILMSEFPKNFSEITPRDISPLEWDILSLQAGIFDAERRQNWAGYAPTVAAFGNYDYRTFGNSASEMGDWYQHSANVGVALSFPLFDGGAKSAAATASSMSAIAAREDLDKSKKLRTAEYNDLIQRHGHLRRSLVDLRKAKDLSERAYRLSRDRFLAGQTSAVELSDVERGLTQMEMAILNTKLQILTTAETIKKYEAAR